MDVIEEKNALIVQSNQQFAPTMVDFENRMMDVYRAAGLPVDDILAPVDERRKVFKNFYDVLDYMPEEHLAYSDFVTKFMTAASVGLFDSALNYLWVETVKQLKIRIKQYDIDYFYDNTIPSELRDQFNTVDDLDKIEPTQLLEGARKIELISEKGYRQLDNIKFMLDDMQRNVTNQSETSGIDLISWLGVCIREVITLQIPSETVQAQLLLRDIRNGLLTQEAAMNADALISIISTKLSNTLIVGLYGLYLREEKNPSIVMNLKRIAPQLWKKSDLATKNEIITSYAIYRINDKPEKTKLARAFITIVGGEEYLPDDVRGYELKLVLNQLLSIHRGMNNFYNEPQFAREVERLVGTLKIPKQLDKDYVITIVDVFITNGNGVCWAADSIYTQLVGRFTERQMFLAATAFLDEHISNKLCRSLCQGKYKEMLEILQSKSTQPALTDFIDSVLAYKTRYDTMSKDSQMKRNIEALRIRYK